MSPFFGDEDDDEEEDESGCSLSDIFNNDSIVFE
jgi:hypothetical protein